MNILKFFEETVQRFPQKTAIAYTAFLNFPIRQSVLQNGFFRQVRQENLLVYLLTAVQIRLFYFWLFYTAVTITYLSIRICRQPRFHSFLQMLNHL